VIPGLVGLGSAAVVAALFYSSFLASPGDVLGPFQAARTYVSRGVSPAAHEHPWHYYIALLAYSSSGGVWWSEGAVFLLAVIAAGAAWLRPGRTAERTFWARYLTCYVAIVMAVFSAIPYKTPWNVLPFHVGVLVLAGIGASTLVQAFRWRPARGILGAAVVIASCHLGWQAWRASVVYASDPRNPYVYAQTLPDTVRMARRIHALAAVHPDGARMQVSVIAPPYEQWPMPWYLRTMPHVGYWVAAGDPLALQAPVIVSSLDQTAVLDRRLGDRYVTEFYGLRPEVFLQLYVERGLWNRFMSAAAVETTVSRCGDDRCAERAPRVAPWLASGAP
jgi:hypothetical protein